MKELTINFQGLSTCLFWFKGTSAQRLLLQSEVGRSGLKPALPFVSFVMIWLLRVEWGENQGKSPLSPWVDNLGFQEAGLCVSMTLLEYPVQTAAQTKPHYNLLSKPMFCLKREAAALNRFPELSLLRLSGMSALVSCFFPLRASPAQPQGPHLSQNWGVWPCSPDSLAHKSSWSTCSPSVSGHPTSPLDVLFPHIRQTTLKPPRAIGNSDGPCPISGSSSVLFCTIACQAHALPHLRPEFGVGQQPCHKCGQLPSGVPYLNWCLHKQ